MSFKPLVSVVIPTKNGESTLYRCLEAIAGQTYSKVEVIIIDSGSNDQTLSIAAQFPFVRVLGIPPHTFNHGATRNLGVSEAKGEYVLLTVQDAYAANNRWIKMMLDHFLKDPEVAGVCGQQIVPHDPDKNPHEWFRPYSTPVPKVVHYKDPVIINTLALQELYKVCGWDNVNAMYRKEILEKHPFRRISFAEDMAWAKEVVSAGQKIVYDYNCRVYHYHHSTEEYTYKRTLTSLYSVYKNFGFVRETRFGMAEYLKVVYRNLKYRVDSQWIFFNWRKMKAADKAYEDVVEVLKDGEEALDEFHAKHCGTPPQGVQNNGFK